VTPSYEGRVAPVRYIVGLRCI